MNVNAARRIDVRLTEINRHAFMVQLSHDGSDREVEDAVMTDSRRSVMRRVTAALEQDNFRPIGRWLRDEGVLQRVWRRGYQKGGADLWPLISSMLGALGLEELRADAS